MHYADLLFGQELASQNEKFDPGQTSRRLSYAECRATRQRLSNDLNQKIGRAMSMSYDMLTTLSLSLISSFLSAI